MLKAIDLFVGCGGLVEGFLQTKSYSTLAAIDWEKPTVKTLEKRLMNKWSYDAESNSVIHFDLQRTEDLIKGYDDPIYGSHKGLESIVQKQNVDVIIGGPPCQAYSIAGRVQDKDGMQKDYRNYLFESYVKLVDYYSPKAFIFENVEGILSAKPGGKPIIDRIKKAFDSIGYDLVEDFRKDTLFNLSYYGVPQSRKRVIIFGVKRSSTSKEKVKKFYQKLREHRSSVPLVTKKSFEGLPKYIPTNENKRGYSHQAVNDLKTVLNHEPRYHNPRDINIFRILAEDIKSGTNKYNSVQSLIDLYKEKTGKVSKFHKYHVIRLDKPSNTIPAHLYKDGLRHIHPDPLQARSITVREAARLQTFPDDFEFLGAKGDQYKMVGNAVPPVFAKKIAEIVEEIL